MSARLNRTGNWEELARRANYSTAALAAACAISIRQLQRDFFRETGQSPERWLNDLRLRDALKLLQEGNSVKVAATVTGYNHSQSFSRAFKQLFGVSPSAVRLVTCRQ
jgi:AraC-like DNA-binding protein